MNVFDTFQLESGQRVTRAGSDGGEALRRRVELLDAEDKLLIELSTVGGASVRKIAELTQIDSGTVSRRLRRIWQRLGDPIVDRLMDSGCTLSGLYRQIGVEHFLVARPTPRIAAEHELSSQQVRQILEFIRTWHRMTRGDLLRRGGRHEEL